MHAAAAARNLHTATTLRSAETELQNTIAQQRSVNKKRQQITWDLSSSAGTDPAWFHANATTPATVAQASQIFSPMEWPFDGMFRANPNIQNLIFDVAVP